MKRRMLLLWALCLLAICAPALAEEAEAPPDVRDYFFKDRYAHWSQDDPWRITGWITLGGKGAEADDIGVALTQVGASAALSVFRRTEQGWKLDYNDAGAVSFDWMQRYGIARDYHDPVAAALLDVSDQRPAFALRIGGEQGQPAFSLTFSLAETEEGPDFLLDHVETPDVRIDLTREGVIGYISRKDGAREDVAAQVDRRLEYFWWETAPLTAREARALYFPTLLRPRAVPFPPNRRIDVYQGPGEEYGRSGGGKGVVSTNGDIFVYGRWTGWVMIGYGIQADYTRVGWIKEGTVPERILADTPELAFYRQAGRIDGYFYGVVTQDTPLWDDAACPGKTGQAARLSRGASVHVLGQAEDGGTYYVRGFRGNKQVMGFVPVGLVDREHGFVQDTRLVIDRAVTYSQADIYAAMEAVKAFFYDEWSGQALMDLRYIEEENADPAAWWRTAFPQWEGMKLYSDLNAMSGYDFEISEYGVVPDWGWILYREPGGDWFVGNYGYE